MVSLLTRNQDNHPISLSTTVAKKSLPPSPSSLEPASFVPKSKTNEDEKVYMSDDMFETNHVVSEDEVDSFPKRNSPIKKNCTSR